ncbi:MAG: hydantoinase/oxoprolinase family protein [Gemmatimonadaceae bacterium]
MSWSVGIDVGGTFTDLVALADDGAVSAGKVPSTPADQSAAVRQVLAESGLEPNAVDRVIHGTTIVTNLLLERRGTPLVLCATRGATDLLELRRQERASLYDLAAQHPAPLVSPNEVIAVDERIAPEGVLRALHDSEAQRVAAAVAQKGGGERGRVVAIALLHAYADASHERRLAAAICRRVPDAQVICSSDVLPEIREYERTATTVCEAYARPSVAQYVGRLAESLAADGFGTLGVIASNGGMLDPAGALSAAASLALSGPAGGVAGAALAARLAGFGRGGALSIDIGGTSADAGLIVDGEPLLESGGQVAGVPIALPRVLVETVSAGGGSLGWVDDGGALRGGPRSAGGVPGPAAFGRGGTQATVTDAHVALGNIRSTHMSGAVRIDAAAAAAAVAALAARLQSTVERTAQAMIATADASMARALRRVSVERGIDPRDCVLIAFGGGGPLHACGLAEQLGMRSVLIPPFAGVLSALGLAAAPARRVTYASVMRRIDKLDSAALGALASRLDGHAQGARGARGARGAAMEYVVRSRYVGQGHELEVPFFREETPEIITMRFAAAHSARYGFTLDVPVEAVSARGTLSNDARTARLAREGRATWRDSERVDDGGPCDAVVRGRAVVALRDATLLVGDGWSARALAMGGWLLTQDA